MTLDITKFNATVEAAKAKAADSPAWLRAIEKAAVALRSGQWIVTELFDGILVTTESGETYHANGVCQRRAYKHGQPCKHRAAARLIELYNEGPNAPQPPKPADERAELIADIKARWPRVCPHLPLATELMARFGKNKIEMSDTDMLRRVRLAIAM